MAEQVFREGISIGSTASYKFPQIKGASGNTLILLDDNGNLGWGLGGSGGGGAVITGTPNSASVFNSSGNGLDSSNLIYTGGMWSIGDSTNAYPFLNTARLAIEGAYSGYNNGGLGLYVHGDQFGGYFKADGANSGQNIGLQVDVSGSTVTGNCGLFVQSYGDTSNTAASFNAVNGKLYPGYVGFDNLGLYIYSSSYGLTGTTAASNAGLQIQVSGRTGDSNYIGQFQDGSEGIGKVLTCVTTDGKARWETPIGGTESQSLSDVMVIGNNTNNKNIIFNDTYGVYHSGGNSYLKFDNSNSSLLKSVNGDNSSFVSVNSSYPTASMSSEKINRGVDNRYSYIDVTHNYTTIVSSLVYAGSGNTYSSFITIGSDSITLRGTYNNSINPSFKGLEYGDNYASQYTNRSLVDKEYVDTLFSNSIPNLSTVLSTGNVTGNNVIKVNQSYGLQHSTKPLYNIQSTSNGWDINAGSTSGISKNHSLKVQYDYIGMSNQYDNYFYFGEKEISLRAPGSVKLEYAGPTAASPLFYGGVSSLPEINGIDKVATYIYSQDANGGFFDIFSQSAYYVDRAITTVRYGSATNASTIEQTLTGITISGPTATFTGVKYDKDYSAQYTNRTLVDKAYVTSAIPKIAHQLACSDETTAITAGTAKVTFRAPYAMTLTEVRASLTTAQTGGNAFTVDIKVNGSSILSTKITIDTNQKTSKTAATQPVISNTSIADDAEITIDVIQIGNGTAKGLKVSLIGTSPTI